MNSVLSPLRKFPSLYNVNVLMDMMSPGVGIWTPKHVDVLGKGCLQATKAGILKLSHGMTMSW